MTINKRIEKHEGNGEKEFDFLQDHSDTFLTMAYDWERRKDMDRPCGSGVRRGVCGDTVTLYLNISNDKIIEMNFKLEGCINTSACCNALASLVEGKSVDSAWEITPNDIIHYLKTLPADHHHCAELAVGAFYMALADYNERKKQGLCI